MVAPSCEVKVSATGRTMRCMYTNENNPISKSLHARSQAVDAAVTRDETEGRERAGGLSYSIAGSHMDMCEPCQAVGTARVIVYRGDRHITRMNWSNDRAYRPWICMGDLPTPPRWSGRRPRSYPSAIGERAALHLAVYCAIAWYGGDTVLALIGIDAGATALAGGIRIGRAGAGVAESVDHG